MCSSTSATLYPRTAFENALFFNSRGGSIILSSENKYVTPFDGNFLRIFGDEPKPQGGYEIIF